MIRDSASVAPAAAHLVAARIAAMGYDVVVRGSPAGPFELEVRGDAGPARVHVAGRRWAARSRSGGEQDAQWSFPISKAGLERADERSVFALVETRDWPDLERKGAVGARVYVVSPQEVRDALAPQLAQRSVGLRFRFDLAGRARHRERWDLLHALLRRAEGGAPEALRVARRARAEAAGEDREDPDRSTIVDLEQRRSRARGAADATWISLPTES